METRNQYVITIVTARLGNSSARIHMWWYHELYVKPYKASEKEHKYAM